MYLLLLILKNTSLSESRGKNYEIHQNHLEILSENMTKICQNIVNSIFKIGILAYFNCF